jgi:hypothetical protein
VVGRACVVVVFMVVVGMSPERGRRRWPWVERGTRRVLTDVEGKRGASRVVVDQHERRFLATVHLERQSTILRQRLTKTMS